MRDPPDDEKIAETVAIVIVVGILIVFVLTICYALGHHPGYRSTLN